MISFGLTRVYKPYWGVVFFVITFKTNADKGNRFGRENIQCVSSPHCNQWKIWNGSKQKHLTFYDFLLFIFLLGSWQCSYFCSHVHDNHIMAFAWSCYCVQMKRNDEKILTSQGVSSHPRSLARKKVRVFSATKWQANIIFHGIHPRKLIVFM